MLRSWKIGRAFGIPLYVHSTFFLLPAWGLYQTLGAGWTMKAFMLLFIVVMFGCILLHELGHALMARYFGIGTRDITLYPIGGVARLERMSEEPAQEVAIALAGPAVNLVIVGLLTPLLILFLLLGWFGGNPIETLERGVYPFLALFTLYLWVGNGSMMLFNLIPAFPLDGGRVLRALLTLGLGHLRATEVAARIGMILAFPLAALAFTSFGSPMLVVIAAFLVMAGQMELAAVRHKNALRQQPVLDAIIVNTDAANPLPSGPRFADATGTLREPTGFSGYLWDAQRNAWVLWRNGRPVAAFGGHSE